MRLAFLFAAALLQAQTVVPVEPALTEIARTHRFLEAAISPDGAHVAFVEAMGAPNQSAIYIAPRIRVTAADGKAVCDEHAIAWSADGKQLAFLSDCGKKSQLQVYLAPAEGGVARQLTHLKGLLADPKWSPDGKRIAILFTENLPHSAGPLDPVPPDSGVLESQIFEQRLTLVDTATGAAHQLTPKDLYVYEYDWAPDGHSFAATAAPGDGDANWWIAQLYLAAGESGEMKSMYKPPAELQIATPRFAPDGKSVVFIGGLMSDEGSTGGDIFQISTAGGAARNLTPGMAASASNITWPRNSRQPFFTEHYDGGSGISQLDPATGQTERLWQGDESIFPRYFNGTQYIQHNPWVADTIPGLIAALQALAAKGRAVVYKSVHKILGEGNFVLVVAEATFGGVPTGIYDLFRIGKVRIAEHWDTLEAIPPRDQWKNSSGKF
jgi:Tol biopolymer transport system component/predicted SnoaL-like aldol condensation-catalyzing enzyme